MKKTIIGIMGPGETATAQDLQNAYELGKNIAQQGWIVLTGGRNIGVMDAASKGAKSVNGLTVGILPGRDHQDVSEAVDIAIFTDMGNARNNINVLSSDVVIACGMGAGTASEVALALKNQKKVILWSWVRIGFKDNGVGMSEQIKKHIFDPFFTTKDVGEGIGLGLSISYQIIVEKHHGRIECISQPGLGAEFIIDIPIQ
jgi:uncharacterized protein (TIGR00725 family)